MLKRTIELDEQMLQILMQPGGFTTSQMALLLNCSVPTVRRYIRDNPDLEVIKVKGSIDRITRASGLRLLAMSEEDVARLVAARRKVAKEVA